MWRPLCDVFHFKMISICSRTAIHHHRRTANNNHTKYETNINDWSWIVVCHPPRSASARCLPLPWIKLKMSAPVPTAVCCQQRRNVVISSHLFSAFEINGSLWNRKIIDTFFSLRSVRCSLRNTIRAQMQTSIRFLLRCVSFGRTKLRYIISNVSLVHWPTVFLYL